MSEEITNQPSAGSAQTQPAAPAAVATTPKVTPTAAPKPSLTAALGAAQAARIPVPKTLHKFNTRDLRSGWFHGLIYGDTHTRKSTTAAHFESPENTRIILTRRPDQLRPLIEDGYEAVNVEDEAALSYALQFPEALWPEWANVPNRTLVIDDVTEAIEMLLESSKDELESGGREVRDPRRTYRQAGEYLRDMLKVTLAKPQHVVMTALEKVTEKKANGEELLAPSLPPSMSALLTTELEFVFWINPVNWMFTTDRSRITVSEEVEGKKKTYTREVFAKNKLPWQLAGKGLLRPMEAMDLRAIWRRVLEAKPTK